MNGITTEQKVYHVLRIAVAMCFIGHGAFGIITKPIWCNYFAVFGIGKDLAFKLMPFVGSMDILFGLIMLVFPIRAVAWWLVIWGIVTASLRPLSGEPFAELIERAGNFGAPVVLLLLTGFNKNIFKKMTPPNHIDEKIFSSVILSLQIIVFLLLAGHGWLNLLEKKGLIQQYTSLGFSNPQQIAYTIGLIEIIAGIAIFIKPLRLMVFLLLFWKIISEFFYPHWEIFEWIERGGSYGCMLALWFAVGLAPYQNWLNRIFSNKNTMQHTA